MPRETKETTIAGTVYRVTQVGAHTGQQILFRVGRALPAMFGNFTPEALNPEDFSFVCERFIEATQVGFVDAKGDGRTTFVSLKIDFDDRFAGKYEQWAEWLKFAWEVNFGSFFGVVASLVRARSELATSMSPKTPPGSAGASPSASA